MGILQKTVKHFTNEIPRSNQFTFAGETLLGISYVHSTHIRNFAQKKKKKERNKTNFHVGEFNRLAIK